MMQQVTDLKEVGVPITKSCAGLAVARSSFYQWQLPKTATSIFKPRAKSQRALSDEEKSKVRKVLNSDRFADQAPRQVYASLLDEEEYHCSVRTMYRILAENNESKERRNQRKHPKRVKPELTATKPN